ncbi:MAG: hypothetical protein CL740_05660 [Chloroflexi bacterium]|nr:hypothetical protein [Chloroflexota bacterium]
MENFYQFGALISAITFSGAGIFIKKINTRNFFSIPFYEGLFSIMIMLLIISLLYNWQDTLSGNSSSIIINFILAATLSSTGTMIYIFSLSKTSMGIALTVCAAVNVLTASSYDYLVNSISFDILFFIGASLIIISIFILNIKSFFAKSKINLLGVFGAILTGILWGSAVFFNDKALFESNIFTASIIRSLTAMIVMFTASIVINKKNKYNR